MLKGVVFLFLIQVLYFLVTVSVSTCEVEVDKWCLLHNAVGVHAVLCSNQKFGSIC